MDKEEKQGYQPICKGNQNRVTPPNTRSHVKMEELEEQLNLTLAENKEIYKKMADLDTALEDCTESLTDARIKIKELEAQISILLSCKNCPENKGGYICQKEYKDKCLAQKIQYIKELKEENAELKKQVEQKQHLADVRLEQSLENYKLFSDERKARIDIDIALEDMTDKLTKAKEIIKELLDTQSQLDPYRDIFKDRILKAEQFIKECE